MLLLIIAVVLAKSGHKTGAWIMYAVCAVLSTMSTVGNYKRMQYLYGSGVKINGGSLFFVLVVYIVVFFIIAMSYDTVKSSNNTITFGLVVAEEIFNKYSQKEHFEYMGVDNPYPLVNKLNDIAEFLGTTLDDNKLETGMRLVEHYGYLYDTLKKNGNDEVEAVTDLEKAYNWAVSDAYVRKLTTYVNNHMEKEQVV